jgi:osmoprotectant transport system ATP-binding protein
LLISLRGVSKSYAQTVALESISLDLRRGGVTVLIGPSGCGKSTLLRLMIGLSVPDAGAVSVDGTTLDRKNVRELRHRMGYVIQEGGLFPHLTALANVTLLARSLKVSPQEIDRRVNELCELTRLPVDILARFPLQLSGGQRQRVSLMRALMLKPQVLLLDEPLGALDPMVRGDLQRDLKSIFRSLGATVVIVTHDLHEAAYFGDQIILMDRGRVVQRGTLREFRERPADPFVTRFLAAQRGPVAEAEA